MLITSPTFAEIFVTSLSFISKINSSSEFNATNTSSWIWGGYRDSDDESSLITNVARDVGVAITSLPAESKATDITTDAIPVP